LLVGDELVGSEAEFAGALAGDEETGGAEVGPVDVGLLDEIEQLCVRDGDGKPWGGHVAAFDDGDAGGDFEAACATDDQETWNSGLLDCLKEVFGDWQELIGVVGGRGVGADDCVGSFDLFRDGIGRRNVALHYGEPWLGGKFGWVAGDRCHLMAAGEKFGEDAAAGRAGGSVKGDEHEKFSVARIACRYWMGVDPESPQNLKKPVSGRVGDQAGCIQPVVYSEREPASQEDAAAPVFEPLEGNHRTRQTLGKTVYSH